MTHDEMIVAALMAASDRNAHWLTLPKHVQASFKTDGTVERMKGGAA